MELQNFETYCINEYEFTGSYSETGMQHINKLSYPEHSNAALEYNYNYFIDASTFENYYLGYKMTDNIDNNYVASMGSLGYFIDINNNHIREFGYFDNEAWVDKEIFIYTKRMNEYDIWQKYNTAEGWLNFFLYTDPKLLTLGLNKLVNIESLIQAGCNYNDISNLIQLTTPEWEVASGITDNFSNELKDEIQKIEITGGHVYTSMLFNDKYTNIIKSSNIAQDCAGILIGNDYILFPDTYNPKHLIFMIDTTILNNSQSSIFYIIVARYNDSEWDDKSNISLNENEKCIVEIFEDGSYYVYKYDTDGNLLTSSESSSSSVMLLNSLNETQLYYSASEKYSKFVKNESYFDNVMVLSHEFNPETQTGVIIFNGSLPTIEEINNEYPDLNIIEIY